MGTHGDFDKLALSACRELRKKYKDIITEVVLTSLNKLRPEIAKDDIFGDDIYTPYSDVKTTMYDIEDEHFKRRIVVSNQKMIDSCDTLICYVDENRTNGWAIRAYKNAKKKDLHIANLMQ